MGAAQEATTDVLLGKGGVSGSPRPQRASDYSEKNIEESRQREKADGVKSRSQPRFHSSFLVESHCTCVVPTVVSCDDT